MANLRVHIAKKLGLIPEVGSGGRWEFLWVVDPPLFEYDEEKRTWVAAHHAFTRPHDDDVQYLRTDPGRVKCWRYDVVLNGFEIGGGSIRLHDPRVQSEVFAALGIGEEEARNKFGFLLDALRYGRPTARRHRPGHGPAGDAPHRRRVPPRRHPVPQDQDRHRQHDRRPGRGGRAAAPRGAHPRRPAAEGMRTAPGQGGRSQPSGRPQSA